VSHAEHSAHGDQATGPSGRPYRFYAAEISYFSGKVRPALRFKGVPFEEVLPTPDVYRDVILPRTGLAFIPIVVTPEDETLQDTSEILDWLEARVPEPALYPTTPVQQIAALLLELYADEFLLLPAMHYRWSFSESEAKARRDFVALAGDEVRANQFADRMHGSLRALGVVPESIPAIEAHLAELLDTFSAHLESHDFLLGSRPSLADCALMGPLYAHLWLDAVPGRLLRERAPRVGAWIERMNAGAGREGRFLPEAANDAAAADALPGSLRTLLTLAGRDAAPLLMNSLASFEAWADEHATPGDTPPRAVGFHETRLRRARFSRYTSSYTPWITQRPADAYAALDPKQRSAVDAALAGTGWEPLLARTPRHRVEKRGFQLVLAGS